MASLLHWKHLHFYIESSSLVLVIDQLDLLSHVIKVYHYISNCFMSDHVVTHLSVYDGLWPAPQGREHK